MEGGFGWQFGGHGYNDWDLYSVVRRGCGAPPPPYCYDPFYALPPAPQAPNVWQQHAMDVLAGAEPAPNVWQQQPDMDDVPVVSDEDFLAQIFFPMAQPPPPAPSTDEVVPPQGAAAGNSPPPAAAVKRGSSSDAGGSSSKQMQKAEVTAVVTVPPGNDVSSADPWTWRKYGHKTIKTNKKGRAYFRCAADDACPARRKVEKCTTNDDEVVTITYTGDHTHAVPLTRNPRAGTTRRNRRRGEPAPPTRRPNNAKVLAGGPSRQAPPPALLVVNPPAPVHPNEFEAEEDDDAIALKLLIDDAVSASENAFLFRAPQPAAPVVNNSYATVWDFASGKAEHVTYLH